MSRINRVVALVAGLLLITAACGAKAQDATPNDVARFLAGMQPAAASPLAAFTRSPSWQRYAKWFDSNWSGVEQKNLSKVRAWAEQHVKNRRLPLYYMFSGPDYLYADAFFPSAATYLLSGLEPVGTLPQVSEHTIASLPRIQHSISSSLQFSFFITRHMREQLASGQLSGTLPILLVYAARSGKTVREISFVDLDKEGNLHPGDHAERRGMVHGVKIVLTSGNGPPQNLYYFRTDLSNGGVNASGFLRFAATFGNGNALLKSASYLLHSGNFSRVRDFILEHSQSVVQDDSGIPLGAFKADLWDFHPFGSYLGPISIFPGKNQPRLGELFRKAKAPRLDFGIGYRHRGHDSNLLLAMRRVPLKAPMPQANQSVPPATPDIAAENRLPPLPPRQPLPPLDVPEAQPKPALRQTVPADQPN
jgi:hypothetical protein